MGYFSDLSIKKFERPQISELSKNVCGMCVIDDALECVVNSNLSANTCDYCGKSSEDKLIAASFNVVMSRIQDSVLKEYGDAQDVDAPWGEKEWHVDQIFTEEVLGDFDPGWNAGFLKDVIGCFDPMTYWVNHSDNDWSIENPSNTLIYGWDNFKDQVLTKTRYLFLAEPEDEFSSGRPDYIPIPKMLEALGNACTSESLVKTVPAGTEFYRVRHASKGAVFKTFSDMGVPPVGSASAGRMNPAGISYLYLAQRLNQPVVNCYPIIPPFSRFVFPAT